MSEEKKVSYLSENSYSTLFDKTNKTRYVWLVFHGLGYLSKYFIRHFKSLDPTENYIICPQAPSKYYQGENFKHVGASWLTREDTLQETGNVLRYIDAVMAQEGLPNPKNLIILGYSQGVSIAMRWMASRNIQCKHLVIHSGDIPVEQTEDDFNYLNEETKVTYLYGTNDPYINEAKKTENTLKSKNLFGNKLSILEFEGVYEVNENFIKLLTE